MKNEIFVRKMLNQGTSEVNGYTEPPLVHAPVDLMIAGHMQNQPIRNAFLNTDIIRVIQNGIPIEFSWHEPLISL